jgi:hypothetical protein
MTTTHSAEELVMVKKNSIGIIGIVVLVVKEKAYGLRKSRIFSLYRR